MRSRTSVFLAIGTLLLPLGASAAAPSGDAPVLPACEPLPPSVARPWSDTERLHYDVDVMGALAGKLVLLAHPPRDVLGSRHVVVRAMAASNSFFSKIRAIRGRASSTLDADTFRPIRYQEETQEGPHERSAVVRFEKEKGLRVVAVDYKRDGRAGKKRFPHPHEAFDPLSAFYALRTMDLAEGQEICFDAYGIRHHWRVSGTVKAVETVKVPAGVFQAYRLEGRAYRVDDPRRSREIHVWISADEKRLPLAALSVIDLGPVRAQLRQIDGAIDEELEDVVLSGLPPPKAPRPAGHRVR